MCQFCQGGVQGVLELSSLMRDWEEGSLFEKRPSDGLTELTIDVWRADLRVVNPLPHGEPLQYGDQALEVRHAAASGVKWSISGAAGARGARGGV